MSTENRLYILSNGRVAALDKNTGEMIWEIRLKNYVKVSSYTYGQIIAEGDRLFVSISGIALCLSAADGSLIWKNELKGWGYSFVSMAGAGAANMETVNATAGAAAATAVLAATVAVSAS